jgi:LmbE family N-acetylglucosaminyl deacetylase
MAVSAWVTAALRHLDAPPALRFSAFTDGWVSRFAPALHEFDAFWPGYPVVTPLRAMAWSRLLDTDLLDRKLVALRAHHSQTARLFAAFGEPFMRAMAATEWFTDPHRTSATVAPWAPERSRSDLSGSVTGSPWSPATACWRSAAAGESPSG